MQYSNTEFSSNHKRHRHLGRFGLVAVAVAAGVSTLALSAPEAFASRSTPVTQNDPLAPIAAQAVLDLQALQADFGRASTDTGDTATLAAIRDRYLTSRDSIAAEVANRVGSDAAQMKKAWAAADYPHQTALMAAISQLGVRYRRNTSEAGVGFDCSGLTAYAWGVAGESLAHQSRTQINAAASRTIDTAQAGDLVYYPGHIMIYLGVDKAMVHSPFTGRSVEVGQVPNRRNIRFGNPMG